MKHQKTILVAALNWGLGHATRCMPIINQLLAQQVRVVLASDGNALLLLQKEYPKLETITLPSYDIHYKSNNMVLNIAPQVPKIVNAIRLERKKLHSIIKNYQIDAVIADNRYGLYNKNIYSIFLTHQLNIQINQKWLGRAVANTNNKLISNFNACWVPDVEGEPNLSGKLAHNTSLKNINYIGALSRMEYQADTLQKYALIAVLSGPEPQRSILEKKIINQARKIPLQFLIIGGRTDENKDEQIATNIRYKSYLTTLELQEAILQSMIVVARSGYSTLMDLVKLKCTKVLLIPTPGQTEQEYLAQHFARQYGYSYQEQKELDLSRAILELKKERKAPSFLECKELELQKAISEMLTNI